MGVEQSITLSGNLMDALNFLSEEKKITYRKFGVQLLGIYQCPKILLSCVKNP